MFAYRTIDDLPSSSPFLPSFFPFPPQTPNPLEHSGPHLDIGILRRPSPLQSIRSDTGISGPLFLVS